MKHGGRPLGSGIGKTARGWMRFRSKVYITKTTCAAVATYFFVPYFELSQLVGQAGTADIQYRTLQQVEGPAARGPVVEAGSTWHAAATEVPWLCCLPTPSPTTRYSFSGEASFYPLQPLF